MPTPEESAIQNFLRTTPGFSLIYGAGEGVGRTIRPVQQQQPKPTGEIPWAPEGQQIQPEKVPFGRETVALAGVGARAGGVWESFTSPYTEYVAPLQSKGPAASLLGNLATWTVNLPSEMIRSAAMVPGGVVVLAARPEWVPGAIAYAATEIGKELVRDPIGTGYKFAVSYAVADLTLRGGSRATQAIIPRITEARALFGSPIEQWGAIRGTTTLFRATRGIESRLRGEPNLGKVLGVGPKAPELTRALSEQTHSIFGRTTEVSQMPDYLVAQRGFTYDVDVLVQNPTLLASQAERIFSGRKVVDIHSFSEAPGYPIGKATGPSKLYSKRAYFPYVPRSKADLLIGKTLTQEKLFVQAGRKATSVIGEPAGLVKWKYGPDYWRLKDVVDLMRTSSYLKGELEAKIEVSSRLNLPVQVMGRLKVRAIEKGLSNVGKYWATQELTGRYLEADVYQPMIRRLSQGKPLTRENVLSINKASRIGELQLRGYKIPTNGRVGISPVMMGKSSPIKSPSLAPSRSTFGLRPSRLMRSSQITSPKTKSSSPIVKNFSRPTTLKITSPKPSSSTPSISPPYHPKSKPPYTPTIRTPPFNPPPPPIPVPISLKIKGGTWWPEEKKQPLKRIASVKDLGWKITNPVPHLKGFLGKKRKKK